MTVLGVAVGGAAGSLLRYFVAMAARMLWPGFPWGTLLVNVVGGFVMGFLTGYAAARPAFPDSLRITLTTGVLGGFTTFSAFSMDTVTLLREGSSAVAMLNIAANVVLALVACLAGHWLSRGLP